MSHIDQRMVPIVVTVQIADQSPRELAGVVIAGASALEVAVKLANTLREIADSLVEAMSEADA